MAWPLRDHWYWYVSASPSRSAKPLTTADTVSLTDGWTGRTVTVPAVGSVVATVVVSVTVSDTWFCGSLADTLTEIVSPRSPLPASARFRVAPVAPAIAVPLRDHWYWYVSGSLSASVKPVVVAVTTWSVRGEAGVIDTVPATGVALVPTIVCPPRTTGLVPPKPSFAVTSTSTRWPLVTRPVRSNVRFVAPGTAVPATYHWYEYVSASPSMSAKPETLARTTSLVDAG